MIAAKSAEPAPKTSVAFRSKAPSAEQVQPLYQLQQTLGNQAIQRWYESGRLQAKLGIGPLGDRFEQEADRVADRVMRMTEPVIQPKPG